MAFSDLHSPRRLNELTRWVSGQKYDFGFGLGDFGTSIDPNEHLTMSLAVRALPTILPRVYVLYGNHDNLDAVQSHPLWLKDGLHAISGYRVFVVNGIWGNNPKRKPWHKNVTAMIGLAKKAREVDLLVTHEHPYGVQFHHRGPSGRFKFVEGSPYHKYFIEAVAKYLKPKLWLFGHSYSRDREILIEEYGLRAMCLDGKAAILDKDFQLLELTSL